MQGAALKTINMKYLLGMRFVDGIVTLTPSRILNDTTNRVAHHFKENLILFTDYSLLIMLENSWIETC